MRLTFDLQNGQFLYSDHRLKKNIVWQKRVKCFPPDPSFLPSSSLGRRKIKSLQSTFPNLILPSFSLSPVSALLTTNKDIDCRYYKPRRVHFLQFADLDLKITPYKPLGPSWPRADVHDWSTLIIRTDQRKNSWRLALRRAGSTHWVGERSKSADPQQFHNQPTFCNTSAFTLSVCSCITGFIKVLVPVL